MLCAISGEAPQVAVISKKTGKIYEKRLIEAYITENGTEPTTGDALTVEDLVAVQAPSAVRPRPPTLTSIPSLLGVFQEEWDALALQTHTLSQKLAQTRQELSNALYQHDAAVRVIARLTKERDEAREALAKVNVGPATNGDTMHIDARPLSDKIQSKIQSTQESLSSTRRKRPVPEDWATADTIAAYTPKSVSQTKCSGGTALAIHPQGDLALVGGSGGAVNVFSTSGNQVVSSFSAGSGNVTGALWAGSRAVIATSKGQVSVRDSGDGTEIATFTPHAGSVSGITLHPSGELFASASADGTYAIYDLDSGVVATQVDTGSDLTCAQFHPDGHLLAVGSKNGAIKVYDVKSGTQAAVFEFGSPLKRIVFSENGFFLAAVAENSSTVSIWDIRKTAEVKSLDAGGVVESLDWDYSGQFLVAGGAGGVVVHHYAKSSKAWSESLRVPVPTTSIAWGQAARSIVTVDIEGKVSQLA